MGEKTQHVAQHKKDTVANLQNLLLKSKVVAALNVENLPADKLAILRSQTRSKMSIIMTKRRLISHAIDLVKDKRKDLIQLKQYLLGMPALLFTENDPFSLFLFLKKSKSKAPAKAGQIAPFDLIVQKGPTPFAPGPIIGELAMLGIKSGVEGGKVAIKEDSVVAKEGEVITQKKAEVLSRLGVEPMEVGLNITAAYEDGITYPAKVLGVDEKQFFSNIMEAARNSFNLACTIAYPIKETISLLIGKAFADAKTLGLQQNIIDGGIIEQLLARAESSALGVKAAGNLSVPEKTPASAFEIGNEAPKANEGSRVKSAEPHQEPSTVPKEQPHPSNGQSTVQKEQLHPPKEQSNVSKEQPPPSKGQPNSPGQEPKAKDAPISTEVKVKELVEKTKQFTMGEVPTAASLIEEAGKQIEAQKQKHKTGSATTFQEHAQKRNSSEGNRPNPNSQPHSTPSNKQPDSVSQSNQDEMKKVEQLTKELMKKGTLRK